MQQACLAFMLCMLAPVAGHAAQTDNGGGSRTWQPVWQAERAYAPLDSIGYAATGSVQTVDALLAGASHGNSVTYAISEAPLTLAQLNRYASTHRGNPLLQLPLAITALAIPVVTSPRSPVTLDDASLCGIFSGRLSDWSQLIDPATDSHYPAAPITVVYRSDASGDTDLLTRHLSQVCIPNFTDPTGVPDSNVVFSETTRFSSLFADGMPRNFVAAAGPAAMCDTLGKFAASGRAALGYLSPVYTNHQLAPDSAEAFANLPVATLRNGNNGRDYRPDPAAVSEAVRGANTHPPQPRDAAQAALWVPGTADPASGYPLAGTVNLVLAQCPDRPAVAAVWANALRLHYHDPVIARLLGGYGLAALPADYVTAIDDDLLSNVGGAALDLGNRAICGVELPAHRSP